MKYFKSINNNQYYRLVTGIVFVLFISHQTIYFLMVDRSDEYGSIINVQTNLQTLHFLVDFNN